MGCKMKKVGPCNFGIPQLKNFLKKVLIDKIYMFLGHEKKKLVPGTFKPPKVEKSAFFGIFLRKEGPNQKIALRK